MELSEQEKSVLAIDVTCEMFNKARINDRAPSRPSYVNFAVSSKHNGAIWEAVVPHNQKLVWENEKSRNSLILETVASDLRMRFVSISNNRDNVGGYHIDQIQSFRVESIHGDSDQITFTGLDNEKQSVSVTINSSGQASSPN